MALEEILTDTMGYHKSKHIDSRSSLFRNENNSTEAIKLQGHHEKITLGWWGLMMGKGKGN